MKFSWDWVQELAGTTIETKQFVELLSAKLFEDVLPSQVPGGTVLDIDVLPNRPDCLSHLGLARELCALTNTRFTAPMYEYHIAEHPAVSVHVEDADACPRYSALVVRGVQVGPSPDWLRERLELCGLKSINNVVDVTNYVMLELGQPMHAFDLRLVDKIIVRPAKEGETIRALDEAQTEYTLHPSMLVIADSNKAIAIAGVKGGAGTGISDGTTDVLLEAANFSSQSIRATSKKLNLRTDASVRFSYGIDPNVTAAALMRAAELLAKVANGTADGELIDVYPNPRTSWVVMLDPAYTRSLLGVGIGDGQIRSILGTLGFDVADHEGKLAVHVPARRLDVNTAEDLIEEVGRIYGYDAIPSTPPALPVYDPAHWVREEDDEHPWDEHEFIVERQGIGRILAGAGYAETYNYVFLSDDLRALFRSEHLHELAQPQSAEYRWLHTSLIPRLLVNVRDNLRFFDDVRLFETGHVFDHIDDGKESARISLVLARKNVKNELFYELKGVVDLLLERLGIADAYYDDVGPFTADQAVLAATVKGKQAEIRVEGTNRMLGFIGQVSPRVADALKLKGTAVIAELDLRTLVAHAQQEREFAPLPKYPSVIRDIAVLVEEGVKIDDILQTVEDAGGDIVEDVDVFDIFEPTGKEKLKTEGDTPEYGKSVAFHIIFRASDRTLTDAEVTKAEVAIKQALQEKLDAQIR